MQNPPSKCVNRKTRNHYARNLNCSCCRLLRLHLLLARKQCVYGSIELIAALEEVEFENEDVAQDCAAEFLNEGAGCGCGAT